MAVDQPQGRKLYQIINDQFQNVRTFQTLSEASDYVDNLQNTYAKEGFYVIALEVACFKPRRESA